MEGGMCIDLRKRDTSRNRLLLTGQAIVPMLMILTTSVSCSRRAGEMPEPPYRIIERILPFSSGLSDEENRQLVQRRPDAKPRQLVQRRPDAKPTLQQEQHRASSPPKVARVHAPDTSSESAPRPASGKKNPPPLLDREKEQLFQQFLEWRKHQTDVP